MRPRPEKLTPTALSNAVGISVPYASQILKGGRVPTVALAIRIYRATGHQIGPISNATRAEIKVLERFGSAA